MTALSTCALRTASATSPPRRSSPRPLLSSSRSLPHRRRHSTHLTPSALPDLTASTSLPLYGALSASIAAIGFAGWKAYLYFQLEYIIASMIGNHVPKGGSRVLQIGGGTRELYYYPGGTVQVAVSQSSTNKGVLENGGVAAKIPVIVRDSPDTRTTDRFNLGPPDSYDAIVLLQKFSRVHNTNAFLQVRPPSSLLPNSCRFLQEISDVLKSSGVLIFVEKSASSRVTCHQEMVVLGGAILDQLKARNDFENVMSDVALQGQDDHVVGVAKKATGRSSSQSKTGFGNS